jgi:Chorismate synthase
MAQGEIRCRDSWISQSAWSLEASFKNWDEVSKNPFFSANSEVVPKLESFMDELRKSGDSVGARITTVAEHVPVGWGAPVYAKLDADLAGAMMSINA